MDIEDVGKRDRWRILSDHTRAPLAQRWLYGAAAEATGRGVIRLAIHDRHGPALTAQLVTRRFGPLTLALATQGPLVSPRCNTARAAKTLKRALKRRGVDLVLMTPSHRLRRLPLSPQAEMLELDLDPPLDTLRAGLHQKWRNALKTAEESGFRVLPTPASQVTLTPLLQAEKARQNAGTYRGLPPEFTLALLEADAAAFRLYKAADAYALFLRHGNVATYHMAHIGPKARAGSGGNLLMWHAITQLKAEGVRRLDLGTIDRKKAPDLARFKTRTGATLRRYGPAQML